MDHTITNLGSGGLGGIIGAFCGWFGLKSRICILEKRQENCQTKEGCRDLRHEMSKQFDNIQATLGRIEKRLDSFSR